MINTGLKESPGPSLSNCMANFAYLGAFLIFTTKSDQYKRCYQIFLEHDNVIIKDGILHLYTLQLSAQKSLQIK